MSHIPFDKIAQFKDVIRDVRRAGPTIGGVVGITASVKVHGTNAGIRFNADGTVTAQSRNRDLSLQSDNCGFAKFVAGLPQDILDLLRVYKDEDGVVYGEWAGKGIQSGVGVSEVEPFLYLFARDPPSGFDDGTAETFGEHRIFFVEPLPALTCVLDVNDAVAVAEYSHRLAEACVAIENECPVAKRFGVSGIGEGLVCECYYVDETTNRDHLKRFKVKGEKHSVSRVKTLVPLDVEKVASIAAFGDKVLTEARLQQGLDYLREMGHELSMKSTGAFLSWVVNDVFTEEAQTFIESGLNDREGRKEIGNRAREWFKGKATL